MQTAGLRTSGQGNCILRGPEESELGVPRTERSPPPWVWLWVLDKVNGYRLTVGNRPGAGCAGSPLTGLPALRTLLSWSLQGCVLLLALFPGTFEVQKILVGGGLMNARLWPQCQAMGLVTLTSGNIPVFLPPELHCSAAVALGKSLPLLCLSFFICEMGIKQYNSCIFSL